MSATVAIVLFAALGALIFFVIGWTLWKIQRRAVKAQPGAEFVAFRVDYIESTYFLAFIGVIVCVGIVALALGYIYP